MISLWFQGTLKSLLQHHSSKASVLWHSAFFMVQLSQTTGKTLPLTRRIFVGKVMSLLVNMLSRLFIAFLPRNKHLLISWLLSPSTVILEPKMLSVIRITGAIDNCQKMIIIGIGHKFLIQWILGAAQGSVSLISSHYLFCF